MTEAAQQVARGEREYVVSHPGRSQYSAGGASACGLAALNCARVVLQGDKTGSHDRVAFIQHLMQRETCEEILRLCLRWPSSVHLDVEEICGAPLFKEFLSLQWADYDQPGFPQFAKLLRRLERSTTSSAALIITRPPEIICVLKISDGSTADAKPIYVTFDSHPRSKHPDGAAFIFHRSLVFASYYLSDLLRYDPQLLNDPALDWQAQLLAQFSAHAYIAKIDSPELSLDAERVLANASLEVLRLKAEIAKIHEVNRTLESDSRTLMQENARLISRVDDLEDVNSRMKRKADSPKHYRTSTYSALTSIVAPYSRPIFGFPPLDPPSNSARSPYRATYASSPSTSHSATQSSSKGKKPARATNGSNIDDDAFAARVQLEWRREQERDADARAAAVEAQRLYDEEDRQLRTQMQYLLSIDQKTFDCVICMDTLPEDVIASVDLCGHEFCRPCLLQYLQSRLTEHRFPILCPACSAKGNDGEPGVISSVLASQLGLNDQEFAVFTELEMASFSILLHCRQCQQTVFVDKGEYEAHETITCPLPGCAHTWCKACSQSIDSAGPKHSCDGTSELNHLMTQEGWKHCPGCRTPTSKTAGCNHMTCIAPGCNMHFCYVCGETIVRSVRPQDIQPAINEHYARCRIRDVPA